jgi:hypothetical protein
MTAGKVLEIGVVCVFAALVFAVCATFVFAAVHVAHGPGLHAIPFPKVW